MNKMFAKQIGRNMEVYVDDMLVKSTETFAHLGDLEEVFSIMRKHKMRLNLSKCSFGVSLRKFLGYMVNSWALKLIRKRYGLSWKWLCLK